LGNKKYNNRKTLSSTVGMLLLTMRMVSVRIAKQQQTENAMGFRGTVHNNVMHMMMKKFS